MTHEKQSRNTKNRGFHHQEQNGMLPLDKQEQDIKYGRKQSIEKNIIYIYIFKN